MSSAQNPEQELLAVSRAGESAVFRVEGLVTKEELLSEQLVAARSLKAELAARRAALMQERIKSLGEMPQDQPGRAAYLRRVGEITAAHLGCYQFSGRALAIQEALAVIAQITPGDKIRLLDSEEGEKRYRQVVGLSVMAPPAGPRVYVHYYPYDNPNEAADGQSLSQGAYVADLAVEVGSEYKPVTPFEILGTASEVVFPTQHQGDANQ